MLLVDPSASTEDRKHNAKTVVLGTVNMEDGKHNAKIAELGTANTGN